MASRPTSPRSALKNPLPPESPKESAVSRLLIAPLTFITFLVSLALVDSHNTALRSSSPPSTLCRIRNFLHGLVFKEKENPYERVRSPDAKGKRKGENEGKEEGEKWYWHSKQRHMMKAEMDDAFRLRNSVAVGLLALGMGCLGGIAVGVGWLWGLVRSWV
ncbi:hypothetical protein GLAREA_04942 [Glarea lozoyensis ATCC 20868]|uniref:Uncharacterized protein n=1 Tax=Glarea lozoyensis (strain ATCC 20868 / MF5171) TaxID=1116229 RepID=S3D808_GLAL2|nr:uncharacterized protein GLAREA_04942 [Glarea lozoyensis ATCC 20868]EPE28151.1 hypothetical protein GLAREA_04942 [Glarea lozoyensis ATCC 20868]